MNKILLKKISKIYFLFLMFPCVFFSSPSYSFDVGVGVHRSDFKGSDDDLIKLIKYYHIKSVRLDYHWSDVERVKGHYQSANPALDSFIYKLSSNGIKPLLVLDYGNKFYGNGKPVTKQQVEGFVNYSLWTVNHFKGEVNIFEVWNEWHLQKPRYLSMNDESAKNYVNLVKNVFNSVKDKYPDVSIIAGSFNPTKLVEENWEHKIFKLGILNYIDGLSIHTYNNDFNSYLPAKNNLELVDAMELDASRVIGKEVPVYITEIGISDHSRNKIPEDKIAGFAMDYIQLAYERKYIKGVWWYDFINDGDDKGDGEDNYGILHSNLKEKVIAKFFRSNLASSKLK